jgi:hypothetical protein
MIGGVSTPPEWTGAPDIPRAANGPTLRIREAEYLAVADACVPADGASGWRSVANRCAKTAEFLESRTWRPVITAPASPERSRSGRRARRFASLRHECYCVSLSSGPTTRE